ncbi:MAG: ComEC/Rec2 family competence protein [Kutzneria sp.]|nr:ComEC/Rec2 family competence protein [Kutzneria sp.]
MGGIGLLALVRGRDRSGLSALSWAVVVLLPADPGLGLDAGFALSVLATGGLVLLAPRWAARLRSAGVPAGIAEALVAPLAAHVVTAPVIAGLSREVSLVAVVANRVPWRQGWGWSLARFGGTGTVALGSAVISYGHVQDVLTAWDYGVLAAHVGPLVLDGLMVISGFALLAMSRTPSADSQAGRSR